MPEGHDKEYNSSDGSNSVSCEDEERHSSSPTQLPCFYIDAETGYNMIFTLNSVPEIFIKAPLPQEQHHEEVRSSELGTNKSHKVQNNMQLHERGG
jgi:hypothetical protein